MTIAVTTDGHVLRIENDRPEVRNALDWEAYEQLSEAWRRLTDDNDLWLGVLTATGDKTFCAGADLSSVPAEIQRRATTGELPAFPPMEFNTSFCPKPIICEMNGDALGGGLELALACDFRIAGSHARFSLPEVRFSGLPGAGGTQRLPRLIGIPRALDMLVTGRIVGAIEAEAMGLVTKVVDRADVRATTAALEETLLTVGPLGVWGIKEAVFRGMETTLERGLTIEQETAARLMASEDFTHGVQAYRAKEKANWKAR
jgi:enoyl-CoA hydratase/carnithine racemase